MSAEPHVPAALMKLPQWACYGRDGDPMDKIPINARTGGNALSNNPATWTDHDTARKAAEKNGWAGVSYVFSADDPFTGIDIDDCRDPETKVIAPWAQEIIDAVPTYWEVSPSGTGVKGWLEGTGAGTGRTWSIADGKVEIYSERKAFTVTGWRLEGTPPEIESRQTELDALMERLEAGKARAKAAQKTTSRTKGKKTKLTDEQVLRRLKGGEKTGPLMEGDLSAYNHDESSATFALCLGIARFVGGDAERIDAVFRLTPLMRDKWDSPRGESTWGGDTIAKVLEKYEPDEGASQKELLVAEADELTLFHTADGVGFVLISRDDHEELLPVMEKACQSWLRHQFWRSEGKAPAAAVLKDALLMIEARALFEGEERSVEVRVSEHAGDVYVDLANERWEAVRIGAAGWEVVPNPRLFRRSAAMQALPTPEAGGSLTELRPFLNVEDDDAFILICAWLVAALSPHGPYPVLILQGEHGSAKSATARLARWLVDPAVAPLKSAPHSERDLMVAAARSRVLAYDNLSGLSPWLGDALCRLATGGGLSTRRLYSNDEETVFEATRPISLNGIDDLTSRADLLSRALVVTLPVLEPEQRRTEKDLEAAFAKARPKLFGALCTAISTALSRLPEVHLEEAPRMADFAAWVVAAEPVLPWEAGRFLEAYAANQEAMSELALEMDHAASLIRAFMQHCHKWSGTATHLLTAMREQAGLAASLRDLPNTPRGAANRLRRLAPALREHGLLVEFHKGTERRIVITNPAGPKDRSIADGAIYRIREDGRRLKENG